MVVKLCNLVGNLKCSVAMHLCSCVLNLQNYEEKNWKAVFLYECNFPGLYGVPCSTLSEHTEQSKGSFAFHWMVRCPLPFQIYQPKKCSDLFRLVFSNTWCSNTTDCEMHSCCMVHDKERVLLCSTHPTEWFMIMSAIKKRLAFLLRGARNVDEASMWI